MTGALDTRTSTPGRRRSGGGLWIKLLLMAAVNAFGFYGIAASWLSEQWGILAFLVVALIAADVVYFWGDKRMLPWKYLFPAAVMLLIFQVFVVIYTAGIAFTNYGDGHNSSKEDAIAALELKYDEPVPGAPSWPVSVIDDGDELGLAVVTDDGVLAARNGEDLAPVSTGDTEVTDGRVTALEGWEVLDRQEAMQRQEDVLDIRVGSGTADGDVLRTNDARTSTSYVSTMSYDEEKDAFVAQDGTEYRPNDTGSFQSDAGEELIPGWRVNVGLSNFTQVFSDSTYAGPFLSVTAWTFAFAFLSVALTFFAGLLMALLFNDPNMRLRGFYRALVIMPYAFPAFLSILIWAGLLNTDFGFFNQVLFGGADINWLGDPWLARLSTLIVNLWLGFPYMFLVTTGALQSIPDDVYKAAKIDGAGAWTTFRKITLPLLMIAVGPLLVASFAMNFNNFNVIYLLTGGGPRDLDSPTGVGATDILISFVYKIAFASGENQYGVASAISLMIFIMVAIVSAVTLIRSNSLKEID
ncbi:ABC transporter permease subunit [Corynebacterium suedekumii]|mgnify:CR=1 FL=1|uniref:Maltose/maltodextrin transport system permease protein n=1 Tax=Corynebacterium suedekumii TaxID=3049801 RepID=A0ABY8VLM0_9CORY|nr:ABC transporter permease subunit [Corynebacterium suedekumii]WIM69123.1 ABC transporter permease subunit [Corynebacterium suedekumii]